MEIFKNSSKKTVKHEVSTKKNHLISAFKSFEVNISDKNKKYFDKVPSLLSAWEQIVVFVSESSESPEPEFECLFLHTLRFVLRAADWRHVSNATKTHLKITLQRFIEVIRKSKKLSSILAQCKVLESVINEDPWGHRVLQKIIQDEDVDEIDDLIDYFHFENGKVIVVRLEMLLESKCEDMAARLAKYFLLTYNRTHALEIDVNQNELDYINDIYFCSLYKTKTKTDLINEIKTFDLCDGLQLLKRYRKHNGVAENFNDYCKNARVWKCGKKVVELISSTLLANAVLHDDMIDLDVGLDDLIQEWASIHATGPNDALPPVALEMIRKYVLIARSSKCIYPFCWFLINNAGGKEIDLDQVSRCLIRAINQNMNEIEQYRVSREREKLKLTYDQLSKGFVLISELFRKFKNIYKECLLTSFSLTPSRECIQKLETFMETVLSQSTESESVVEPSVKVEDASSTELKVDVAIENGEDVYVKTSLNDELSTPKVEHRNQSEQNVPMLNEIFENFGVVKSEAEVSIELNTSFKESVNSETIKGAAPAYFAEVDILEVDESIKTDLNSILRYQRYHTLTWDIEWSELKANCEKYLEVFEQRGFDEVELKYLELDYNQFKNKPIDYDEFGGIEKGYEHFVESSESEADLSYNREDSYSSGDVYSDKEYGPKKRKKLRGSDEERRRKMKKKRVPHAPPLPKPEYDPDEICDYEYRQFKVWQPGCEKDIDISPDVKKVKRRRSSDGDIKMKKRGRPRKYLDADELSDMNADSQSENQPPDADVNADPLIENQPLEVDVKGEAPPSAKEDEIVPYDDTVLENISNTKSSPNNLQALRQFRINQTKPMADESTETCTREDEVKPQKDVISDLPVRGTILKICIPKCDDIKINGRLMSVKEIDSCERPRLKRRLSNQNTPVEKKKSRYSDDSENEVYPRPKPRSSATLSYIDKRVPTLKLRRIRDPNEENMNIRNCEIRLPKINELIRDSKDLNYRECEIRLRKITESDVLAIKYASGDNSKDAKSESIDKLSDVNSVCSKMIDEAIDNDRLKKPNDPTVDLGKNGSILTNNVAVSINAENSLFLEEEGGPQKSIDAAAELDKEISAQKSRNPTNNLEENGMRTLNNPTENTHEGNNEQNFSSPWSDLDKELFSCFNDPLPEVPIIQPVIEKSGASAESSETKITETASAASNSTKKVKIKLPKPPRKPREKSATSKPRKSSKKKLSDNELPLGTTCDSKDKLFTTPSPAVPSAIPNDNLPVPSASETFSPMRIDQNNGIPDTCLPLVSTSTAESRVSAAPPPKVSKSTPKKRLPGAPSVRVSSTTPKTKTKTPVKSALSTSYLNSYHGQAYQLPSSSPMNGSSAVYGTVSSTVTSPALTPLQSMTPTPQLPHNSSAQNMSFVPSSNSPVSYIQPSSSAASYSPASMISTYSSLPNLPSASSTVTSTNVHSVQYAPAKSNCKLRAALQKPEQNNVNLYNSGYTMKQPAREGNSEAVNQILDAYRDTLDKFPQLEHVPAPRKRSTNPTTGQRRQRRSKKDVQSNDVNINPSTINSAYNNVERDYSRLSDVNSSQANHANVPQASQMSSVHIPQTGHIMQSNQLNVSAPSNGVQKLPTYVSTNVSSQNYGVTERKSVVNSYLNMSHNSVVLNGYTNNAMTPTNTYLVNNVGSNMTMCNTNMVNNVSNGPTLMNLDQQNYTALTPAQSTTYIELQPTTQTSMSVNNDCGMNNNNDYKMYSYSVNPSTSGTQNTAIVNSSSNSYKNGVQMSSGDAMTNSTMLLTSNTVNVNNELKTPFLYATVYSNEGTTEQNDSSVCISIPEDAYSDSIYGNCLALIENNSLLGHNDDVYMKNQTNELTANTQNVQYLTTNDTMKQDNSVYQNGVLINMNDLFYPNNSYSTEMNYGT